MNAKPATSHGLQCNLGRYRTLRNTSVFYHSTCNGLQVLLSPGKNIRGTFREGDPLSQVPVAATTCKTEGFLQGDPFESRGFRMDLNGAPSSLLE